MKLLRFLTQEEYEKLMALSSISLLVSSNQHNYYHADTYHGRDELKNLPEVAWINDCLKTVIDHFVSFSNFVESTPHRIRVQYQWSPYFTGVGYVNLIELKEGFKPVWVDGEEKRP